MCMLCQVFGAEYGERFHSTQALDADNLAALATSAAAGLNGAAAAQAAATPANGVGVAASGNPYIDGLLGGTKWNGPISYSFPDSRGDYEFSYPEADDFGFAQVSFNQMQAVRHILEGSSPLAGGPKMLYGSVEAFSNLSLSDAGFNGADIRLARSDAANPTAYAYLPSDDYFGGDVWFGNSYDYTNPVLGNYSYLTHVHELGHALGLKHGHESGGPGNTAVPADRDALEFTVMTYRSYIGGPTDGYTNEQFGYPQTYMMLDIAALQYMYGADYGVNSGNTVYSWSSSTGEMFVNGVGQGQPGANRVFLTIWDGGGQGQPGGGGNEWEIQGVGDYNGDNLDDILWRQDGGSVVVWGLNGTTISDIFSPGGAGNEWLIL